jgi:CBS domain-containing protein
VLILPVTDDHQVRGIITRQDFFSSLAQRFLDG